MSINESQSPQTDQVADLYECACNGDLAKLEAHLQDRGIHIDYRDTDGYSALMLAVQKGELRALRTLIAAKADVNIERSTTTIVTPVMMAVETGNVDCVQALIHGGADVCNTTYGGRMLLMSAVERDTECAELLINLFTECNPTVLTDYGPTLLTKASSLGNEKIVRALLKSGVSANSLDWEGCSALMGTYSEECARILIQAGTDVNHVNRFGRTALMSAASWGRSMIAKLLIEAGANLDLSDKSGRTVLMFAICYRDKQIVRKLIEAGANVNMQDNDGSSALLLASENRSFECCSSGAVEYIQILLKAGASLDLTNNKGFTALMNASAAGDFDCVRALIEAGDSVNKQDKDGNNALLHATDKACHCRPTEKCIEALIEAGIDPNISNKSGRTALMNAAMARNQNKVQILIKAGTNINAQDINGNSALLLATDKAYNKECLIALIKAGAILDLTNNCGRTALMNLSYAGDSDALEVMLQAGAKVNIQDVDGANALHLALQKIQLREKHNSVSDSDERCVCSLIDAGADLDSVDKTGCTALMMAIQAGNMNIVRKLMQAGASLDIKNTFIADTFSLLRADAKDLIQLKVCNGIVDTFPKYMSLLGFALSLKKFGIVKYFFANCYLTNLDLRDLRAVAANAPKSATDLNQHEGMMPFLQRSFRQPWPLVKLAFIAVSSALGGSPERKERIKKTSLPARIQRLLMFQEPISHLPVSDWANIPMCFDPEEYEKLPQPRPLLYNWPIGKDLTGILRAASEDDSNQRKAIAACTILHQLMKIGILDNDLSVQSKKLCITSNLVSLSMEDQDGSLFFDEEESI